MKIQKRFIRKYKDKDYFKYIINVPPMILRESGIKEGDEIEIKVDKKKITVEKK